MKDAITLAVSVDRFIKNEIEKGSFESAKMEEFLVSLAEAVEEKNSKAPGVIQTTKMNFVRYSIPLTYVFEDEKQIRRRRVRKDFPLSRRPAVSKAVAKRERASDIVAAGKSTQQHP